MIKNETIQNWAIPVGAILLLVMGILLYYLENIPIQDSNVKYDIYGEKYTYFGDGRFQMAPIPGNIYSLWMLDLKFAGEGYGDLLFSFVDYYFFEEGALYVSGETHSGTAETFDGEEVFFGGKDTMTGESLKYTEKENIPSYLVLNIETGEADYYHSLNDIPEADRVYFQMDLDRKCLKQRTCYEEGYLR